MQASTRDETRWLARLLAVVPVMLGVRLIMIQVHRFTTDPLTLLMIGISVGISVLLFWLGYRLWTCASLWDIFIWLTQTSVITLYLQACYNDIHRHVRAGLVGGLFVIALQNVRILLIVLYGLSPHHWSARMIFWPIRFFLKTVNLPKCPGLPILIAITYLFAIGFLIGSLLSFLRARFGQPPSNTKPEGLEAW